jgi:hypothetical protein
MCLICHYSPISANGTIARPPLDVIGNHLAVQRMLGRMVTKESLRMPHIAGDVQIFLPIDIFDSVLSGPNRLVG